jgi:predicted dehydrogenase
MKKPLPNLRMNRRHFLATTGLALAAPVVVPASALGREDRAAASERVTLGVVGWGVQGPNDTAEALKLKDCQVVAACDLDANHLRDAVNKINGHYNNKDCRPCHDYRELMARRDIDAVILAVPDSWHALIATEAARNKKDIYGEKPLARTIAEQQAIVRAVKENDRLWQTGSWQRSLRPFRRAAEIVRNGLIGKITRVEVGLPGGYIDAVGTRDKTSITQPPPELDYDFWIGPARMEPYIEARVHHNWRYNYNIGGGLLLDWIGHHCDIAHWGLDMDDTGGPAEVQGEGEFPAEDAVWNTCSKCRINLKYPDNISMVIACGHDDLKGGVKWTGTDGWVWVDRGGFDASNLDWFQKLPEGCTVELYKSDNHMANFIQCIKSRKPAITPADTAHHSAIPGHLGLISMLLGEKKDNGLRVGRRLKWDAQKEVIVGDNEAGKLLSRPYHNHWRLA